MSAYIVLADIQKRISPSKLVQLTDFENGGMIDTERVSACIASASSLIDSYCAARYTLPLTASDQIKDAALVICIYKLYSLRGAPPDNFRQDYEDTIAFLKDVAAGKATLDQATVAQTISSTGVVTRDHDTDPEVFDSTKLVDF